MNNEDYSSALRDIEKGRRERNSKRKKQVRVKRTIITIVLLLIIGVAAFFILKDRIKVGGDKKPASGEYSVVKDPDGSGQAGTDSGKNEVGNNEATKNEAGKNETDKINTAEIGIAEQLDRKESGNTGDLSVKEGTETDAELANATDFDIELTFIGDCCMGSQLENMSEGSMLWCVENYPPDYFFKKVDKYFKDDDFTVANCENAISDNPGSLRDKGPDGGFWFKSPSKSANIFKVAGIDAVTLCNNHILDYGEDVLEDTKKALDDAGVQWGYHDKIVYYEKGGFKIAVICSAYYTPDEVYETEEYLTEAIKNSDFQIIYYHGGIEHIYYPEGWMIDANRNLVDMGADLIIGSHPHCLQPIENYEGVDIVYSLGNFCFGGNDYPMPNRTMIYKYHLKIHRDNGKNQLVSGEHEIIPCYVFTGEWNNWQPAPIEDKEEAYEVTGFVTGEIDLPWPVYGDLYDEYDDEESGDSGSDETYEESDYSEDVY